MLKGHTSSMLNLSIRRIGLDETTVAHAVAKTCLAGGAAGMVGMGGGTSFHHYCHSGPEMPEYWS